ncbi:MAG: PhoU domain-containing protein [Actinomycetota bacterium]
MLATTRSIEDRPGSSTTRAERRPLEVLFVCERNDAAAQMAAATFNARAGGRGQARSAGAAPAPALLTEAIIVLQEIGVDLPGDVPGPLTPAIQLAADLIITLDGPDGVDVLDGKRFATWCLVHPCGGDLMGFRRMRDQIAEAVDGLIAQIAAPTVTSHRAFDHELDALETSVTDLADAVVDFVNATARVVEGIDEPDTVAARALDADIDAAYVAIEEATLRLIARRQPVAGDLRRILALDRTALHLERIADTEVDVVDFLAATGRPDAGVSALLSRMNTMVARMTERAIEALATRDAAAAVAVEQLDDELDDLHRAVFDRLTDELDSGAHDTVLMDRCARALERAGDHAVDIAEEVCFLVTGELRDLANPNT